MTVKEYLQQIGIMDRKINLDLRRLDELRELSMKISGGGFDQSYNPNKAQEAPFTKTIGRVMDLERKITEEIDAYVDFKEKALAMIREVPDFDQREVLEMRYARQMSWDAISAERHYSKRWVYQLHGSALQALENILGERGENL